MHKLPRCPASLLLAVVLPLLFTAACAHSPHQTKNKAKANEQRLMLNEGYSMLYHDAKSLDRSNLILYVKVESDKMDKMVTEVAAYGGELKNKLERIAKDYPAVNINLDPLPEMEKRKRAAIAKDLVRYFAPIIGHSGREYERRVLLGFYNGLNHEGHLCRVMAEVEPEAALKEFLLNTEKGYDVLYKKVATLLEKDYFK